MKTNKKMAMLGLVMALVLTMLAGCSGSGSGKDDNKLVIGIDDKFAPMGFRDENNEIVGFDIDYAKAAAAKWDGGHLPADRLVGQGIRVEQRTDRLDLERIYDYGRTQGQGIVHEALFEK
ncbi:hypothetical protein HMSSN139_67740 [Paenibacillus sp. HMSSN-139]|nr:hypothetical protein HMSSN139_67740 [Paenibacillus sp. HMSSN-139]